MAGKKLRCWVKSKEVKDVYINDTQRKRIGVFSPYLSIRKSNYEYIQGGYKLTNKTFYDVQVIKYTTTEDLGQFKTKPQAIKEAHSYMKEHDRC